MHFKNPANTKTASGRVGWCICTICSNQQCLKSIPVPCSNWQQRIRNRWKVRLNLSNLIYNYLTIYKWVVYEFCFWNKKQIRNKNGFLGKSSFFCLHYFSFLSLACNQSTNPSYYYAFSSWFNICFFIYPGIRSEKRKVLFSMIGINMCKVKNNHPSNQIFVYF